MKVIGLLLGGALFASSSVGVARPTTAVVVVFEAQADGLEIEPSTLGRLTQYVAARLAGADGFSVVPDRELADALRERQVDSHRACYDEACQIEIGRALAAEKTMATRVVRLGRICAVSLVVFDIAKSTSDFAETVEGGCEESELVHSLRGALAAFGGAGRGGPDATSAGPPEASPASPPAQAEAEVPRPAAGRLELFTRAGLHFGLIAQEDPAADARRVAGGPIVQGGLRLRLVSSLWFEAHGGVGLWRLGGTSGPDADDPRTSVIGRFGGGPLLRVALGAAGRPPATIAFAADVTVDTGGHAYLAGGARLELGWFEVGGSVGAQLPSRIFNGQVTLGARLGLL